MKAAVKVWFVGVIHGENETLYMSTEFLSEVLYIIHPSMDPGRENDTLLTSVFLF